MRRLNERVGAICELRVQTATKLDLKRLAIYTVGIVIGSEQSSFSVPNLSTVYVLSVKSFDR